MTAISAVQPIFLTPEVPMGPCSQLVFTLTGTTTAANVYADAALSTSLGSTLTADANGLFPQFFMDPAVQYRMRGIPSGGDPAHPAFDHDPVNSPSTSLTAAQVDAALGYTPVDPANAAFTAEARLSYASALTVLHNDSIGFRIMPPNVKDTAYTLTLDDMGKLLVHDDTSTPTWTIPAHSTTAFPIGSWFEMVNVNTGNVTITCDTVVTLILAGSGTSANRTLTEWGRAKVFQYDTDKWMAFGTGIS